MKLEQHVQNEIIRQICLYYSPTAIYLYGSYARGLATAESDIDVCVLMPAGVTVQRYNFILNKVLKTAVHKDVHVVFCTNKNAWCELLIYQTK